MADSPKGILQRLRPWVPAILWAVVISFASTGSFGSSHTSRFLIPLLHRLLPFASMATLELMHAVIRKSAHVTEYFIFSVLLFRAVRGDDRGWKLPWAIWAVAIAAGYAAFDEFHQLFVPGRHASPWDSLLDTAGATLAQVVLWIWFYVRGRRKVTGDS